MGRRNEVLAWNPVGHLLLAGHLDVDAPQRPTDRPNLTRMRFLDPHTRELYGNWRAEASMAVDSMRFVAAQFRDDRELAELTLNGPDFASLWAKHPVQKCMSGLKQFHHPEVGDFDLGFEVLHLPDANGQRLMTHTAEPGSPAEASLALLQATGTAERHAPQETSRPGDLSAASALGQTLPGSTPLTSRSGPG